MKKVISAKSLFASVSLLTLCALVSFARIDFTASTTVTSDLNDSWGIVVDYPKQAGNISTTRGDVVVTVGKGVAVTASNSLNVYGSGSSIVFLGNNQINVSQIQIYGGASTTGASMEFYNSTINATDIYVRAAGASLCLKDSNVTLNGKLNFTTGATLVIDGGSITADSFSQIGVSSKNTCADIKLLNGAKLDLTGVGKSYAMQSHNIYVDSTSSFTSTAQDHYYGEISVESDSTVSFSANSKVENLKFVLKDDVVSSTGSELDLSAFDNVKIGTDSVLLSSITDIIVQDKNKQQYEMYFDQDSNSYRAGASIGTYFTGKDDYFDGISVSGESSKAVFTTGNIDDMIVGEISAQATTGDAVAISSGGDMKLTAASGAVISATNDAGTGVAIKSGGNATISTTDTLTITGNIEVADTLELAANTKINFTQDNAVVKATTLAGEGAKDFAQNQFYQINAISATGLIGTYLPDATSKRIEANISDTAIAGDSIEGKFLQDTSGVLGWEITKNTYIQDNVAKTVAEKETAKLLDSAKTKDNGGVQDQATVAQKIAAISNIAGLDMGTIAKMAYEHTALAENVYQDTFFRAGRLNDTWRNNNIENLKGAEIQVGVSSINRFGTAGASGGTSDYDFNTYGAMTTADSKLGALLVGGGVGGWTMEVDNGLAGKADSTSIAINFYVDWFFWDNFDWFTTVYYGASMNTLERNDASGVVNTDWDGNLIGTMTALRYNYNVADIVVLKPFIGMMFSYNMQDSLTEKGGTFNFASKSQEYTNVKGIVGMELAWSPLKALYFSGRVMYAHEFADNKYDLSMSMLGWGNVSYTGYKTSESSLIAGVGVGYQFTQAWSASINYNAEIRSSELNNNINLSVGYKF